MTDQKASWRLLYTHYLQSFLCILLTGVFFLQLAKPCCAAQLNEENSLYTVALGAYRDGFYDLAIDQFSQLLRLYPKCSKAPYALFRIAEAWFKQKKYTQALSNYKKVLNQYPSKSNLIDKCLYRIGRIYFLRQKYEMAASSYEQLVKKHADSRLLGNALFWFAESNSRAGKFKEAVKPYRRFLKRYPSHDRAVEASYGLGWAYFKLKNYAQALEVFQQLIEQYPKSKLVASARFTRADIKYRLGRYEKAAKAYQEFIRKYPGSSRARLALYSEGLSFYKAKQFSKAAEVYKQFLKRHPRDELAETVAFQQGFCQFKLESYALAAAQLDKFVNNYAKSSYLPKAYYYLALSNRKLEKNDLAEKQLNYITCEFPDSSVYANAWLQLGTIYYQTQRFSKAVSACQRASTSSDRRIAAEALYWLGESYTGQKDYDMAIRTFLLIPRKYAGVDNWAVMAQMRTAGIYEYRKEFFDALDLYEIVAKMPKGNYFKQAAEQRIKKLQSKINGQNNKQK